MRKELARQSVACAGNEPTIRHQSCCRKTGGWWAPCCGNDHHRLTVEQSAHDSDFGQRNLLLGHMPPENSPPHHLPLSGRSGRPPAVPQTFFSAPWCKEALVARQPGVSLLQCGNASHGVATTLRGFSCQLAPHPEAMVRRCTRGRIFAVFVDFIGYCS